MFPFPTKRQADRSALNVRRDFLGRTASLMLAMGLICVLQWISPQSVFAESQGKPNFVFIVADDLGYREVGCFGQKLIETPNLDRLASQGMKLTQHYCGNAVCAVAVRAVDGKTSGARLYPQQ